MILTLAIYASAAVGVISAMYLIGAGFQTWRERRELRRLNATPEQSAGA